MGFFCKIWEIAPDDSSVSSNDNDADNDCNNDNNDEVLNEHNNEHNMDDYIVKVVAYNRIRIVLLPSVLLHFCLRCYKTKLYSRKSVTWSAVPHALLLVS